MEAKQIDLEGELEAARQRFMAIEFSYPPRDLEARIIEREAGVSKEIAVSLVTVGEKVRNLKNHGLEEGVSTRLLIYAGQLIKSGVKPQAACEAAIIRPITDDGDMQRSLREIVTAVF